MSSPHVNASADVAFVFDNGLGCGGAERVALHLIRHWLRSGRRVALVTMTGPEQDFYAAPEGVIRIVTGGIAASSNRVVGLLQNLSRLLRLRRALRASGAPVILSFGTRTNVRVAFAALGLNKRVVLSERSDPSRQHFGWPWALLRRFIYRAADLVTANSQNALDLLASVVPRGKLAFTPNPLSLPDRPASLVDSKVILNVGSLKWHKGQGLLIDAFSRLVDRAPSWRVELLGEGPERSKLEREIAAKNLSERVVLRGLTADPDPHYQGAAIFAFPSIFEGTPNALLEAMSHGLACVVSDALPGAMAYLQNGVTGLTFRTGDVEDLADKLARLIHDPELRSRLGAAARARMEQASAGAQSGVWDELLWPAQRCA